jgi:hypothetical protein
MKNIIRNISSAAVLGLALVTAQTTLMAQTAVESSSSTTKTITSAGTISEFSPDSIVIKTETSPEPVHYTYTKSTTYVDENGAPVSIETVKSGLPVTVYYVKDGDNMVVSKVIVRKAVVVAPAAPAPVVEEKKSTTTTTTDQ